MAMATDSAASSGLVWVTRPKPQASELTQLLEQAHCRVIVAPVLDIRPLGKSDPALSPALACFNKLAEVDHLIFVSANAARFGLACLDQLGISVPATVKVYGVGPSTEQQLEPLARQILIPEQDFTSEGLLAMASLQQVAGSKVLIVRGLGGRSLLATELAGRGATVEMAELYRRAPPDNLPSSLIAELQAGGIGAIMAASGETLTNLVALTGLWLDNLHSLPLVVPGERVAKIARQYGFLQVLIARSAMARDMCDALLASDAARRLLTGVKE
jgi:uroporphyrinogen-III synthase